MIDIEEAIGVAQNNGGIGTISTDTGPVAYVVTERKMRSLLGASAEPAAPVKRKPTRGERRSRAKMRRSAEAARERDRRAKITRQDNRNLNRKINRRKQQGQGLVTAGLGDLQHDLNRQTFGGGFVVPTTRR